MRFLSRWWVSLAFIFAVPAAAQTVHRADLLGVWYGDAEGDSTFQANAKDDHALLVLWSDGLCYWEGFSHGGGRWQLLGDSLVITHDWRYTYAAVFYRKVFDRKEDFKQGTNIDTANIFTPVDTLDMPLFMKYLSNDPYYWIADNKLRKSLYQEYYDKKFSPEERSDMVGQNLIKEWAHASYKVNLKDHRLSLTRTDSRARPGIPVQAWTLVRIGSTHASLRTP